LTVGLELAASDRRIARGDELRRVLVESGSFEPIDVLDELPLRSSLATQAMAA